MKMNFFEVSIHDVNIILTDIARKCCSTSLMSRNENGEIFICSFIGSCYYFLSLNIITL